MKALVVTSALAGICWVGSSVLAFQSAKAIDYDTFCKLVDPQARRAAFLETSPANRADLVRTQLERWRDANRARLNDKQLAALTDLIAVITPDTYGEGPKADEARAKARAVSEVQQQLFTNDDMQAMQPTAPCIAKK